MGITNRKFSNDKYRYGFNGKEKENDISTGDLDFGARIYDARIGKWFSTDPLERKYVAFSPYCFAINSPLILIDYDGRDIFIVTSTGTSRLAKETLLKTATGKALWDKYAKSKTDDIYIAVSSFPKGSTAGAMTQYGIEGTTMIKTEAYLNKENKAALRNVIAVDSKSKNEAGFEALEGTDVTKSSGKKIHLVVLNKNDFSDEASKRKKYADDYNLGNLDESKYDLAEEIFHEIKAHIDLHGSKDEHTAYGKSVNGVFRTDILPAKGTPAEKIKNELKKLYDKEKEAKKAKEEQQKKALSKDSIPSKN